MTTEQILRLSPREHDYLGMQQADEERKRNADRAINELPSREGQEGMNYEVVVAVVKCFVCLLFVFLLRHQLRWKDSNDYYRKRTTILVWNEEPSWRLSQCGCLITNIRDYANANFSAVVVDADFPYSLKGLERVQRKENCLTVFASRNPLTLAQNPLKGQANPLFNFTMTYRRDSDVIWNAYYFIETTYRDRIHHFEAEDDDIVPMPRKEAIKLAKALKNKHFLLMYLMYNVHDSTRSESDYLRELRKHLDIAAYFSCHHQGCSWYKFMLVFEPSGCPDYVHPQLLMALDNYVVPVLIGPGNLSGLVPPDSYISSSDFTSPKLLAKHLQDLAEQPEKYEQFFRWHSKYALRKNKLEYCDLCRALRRPLDPVLQSEQFKSWWTQYQCPNQSDRLHSSSSSRGSGSKGF